MDRSGIIARAAEVVLEHDTDDDVLRELARRFSGDDYRQAEVLAIALIFVKEELGRREVQQIRDKHRRLAWLRV